MSRKQGGRKKHTRNGSDDQASAEAIPAARPGTRKVVLAALLVVIAGLLALVLFRVYGPSGRRTPVILISIDTLRADHLPAYGHGRIQTPAIDELARNGFVFENCYTHVPLTLPAHASLFTGLLPPAHGVRNNIGFRLANGSRTLAGELKQAGYSTGGAVSSFVLHSTTGISKGFDWYDDDLKSTGPEAPATEIQRDGMETLDRALAWLEGQSDGRGFPTFRKAPVFLFLHLYEPHAPYAPPSRFLGQGRSPYDGEVMYSDEIVGRLLERLRGLGLYDESLIVLLSDHGEALGDHGEPDHGVFLYREVMRVPLIVKLPGKKSGGNRIQSPVQLTDVAPTVLDWAGLPPNPQLQGTSLVPALRGRELPEDRRVYGESLYGRFHFGWKELFSLTGSQYSFILAPRQELYDIRQDPGQIHDLLAPGAPTATADTGLPRPVALEHESLHRKLKSVIGQTALEAPDPVDEEELKKLRALGYIGSPTLDASGDDSAPDPKDRIGDLVLYRQAMRMKRIYMFSRVAETLRVVLKTSPRMIDAWDELSEASLRLGDLDGAADALRKSLRIAPHRNRQLSGLADILIRQRRFDEAREVLKTAASEKPDEAEARRAFLEIAQGRPEAAREAAGRAAKGLPAAVPFTEGVLLFERQEYSKAVPLLRKALEGVQGRSPHSLPYVHFYLGAALVQESRNVEDEATRSRLRKESERLLGTELSLNPTNADAATSLCALHATARDVKKVQEVLNGFARQNPSVATYELVADLYGRMGLSAIAAQWKERARRGTGS